MYVVKKFLANHFPFNQVIVFYDIHKFFIFSSQIYMFSRCDLSYCIFKKQVYLEVIHRPYISPIKCFQFKVFFSIFIQLGNNFHSLNLGLFKISSKKTQNSYPLLVTLYSSLMLRSLPSSRPGATTHLLSVSMGLLIWAFHITRITCDHLWSVTFSSFIHAIGISILLYCQVIFLYVNMYFVYAFLG